MQFSFPDLQASVSWANSCVCFDVWIGYRGGGSNRNLGMDNCSLTMSFFGGIPYRGCERAFLNVPDPGQTGTILATTYSGVVVGVGVSCSFSDVTTLNPSTVRARTQVYRNGQLYQTGNCTSATNYNTAGQSYVTASSPGTCQKSSTSSYRWSVYGTYGWYDYDDTTWRSEAIENPSFTQ